MSRRIETIETNHPAESKNLERSKPVESRVFVNFSFYDPRTHSARGVGLTKKGADSIIDLIEERRDSVLADPACGVIAILCGSLSERDLVRYFRARLTALFSVEDQTNEKIIRLLDRAQAMNHAIQLGQKTGEVEVALSAESAFDWEREPLVFQWYKEEEEEIRVADLLLRRAA